MKVATMCLLAILTAGCDAMVDRQMNDIQTKVAQDAENQYHMVETNGGSNMDRCVQAGMVSAAYLQAQNQEKYRYWKAMENADCARAGLPRSE